jgi:hypothetical protein
MNALAEQDYLREMATRLTEAKHGSRSQLLAQAELMLGTSRQHLYRKLAAAGWSHERKTRTDKGQSSVSADELERVAGLLTESTRANGKRLLSVETACDILRANGQLQSEVQPARINALLKEHALHPDQLQAATPHTALRSLHPNHVWQLDASVCVLFYLKTGGLAVMEEREFNKNKPANFIKIHQQRLTRWLVTDHTSGAFFLQYRTGVESAENLIGFFQDALQKREKQPFYGVPSKLLCDKGSANLSGLFQNLLLRLGIDLLTHEVGNARAKGQVERSHDIVERQFEGRLAFLNIQSLDELNQKASAFTVWFNSEKTHTRHGQTRYAMWLRIKAAELRIPPSRELCQELVTTNPKEVTVRGDLTIAHRGQRFDVRHLPRVMVGGKVTVLVNAYRAPAIDAEYISEDGEVCWRTLEPIGLDDFGFNEAAPVIGESYAGLPDTQADTQRKKIRKAAYQAETEADVRKARKSGVRPFKNQINPMADIEQAPERQWIGRHGTDLHSSPRRVEAVRLSTVQATIKIRALYKGEWSPQHYQKLVSDWPDGVPEDQISQIATSLESSQAVTIARQKLRVVGGRR